MVAKHTRSLSIKAFYKEFLRHTSNSMPAHRRLTDMEIEVLTEFWILEGDMVNKDRFSTSVRRYIREDVFNFKNYSNLDNYLKSLIDKGFILQNGKVLVINPRYDIPKDRLRKDKVVTLQYEFRLEETS